ncbi:MAG: tetratricopeptide repeat protein [Gammaproteobacteria bacterium]
MDKNILDLQQAQSLAQYYYQKEQYTAAESLCKKILSLHNKKHMAFDLLALIAMKKEKLSEALILLDKAIAIAPEHSEYHNHLGNIFLLKNDFDQAEKAFKKSIKYAPDLAHNYYNLAVALQNKKQWREAQQFYQKTLSMEPGYINAYNNLGTIYRQHRKFKEAKITLEKGYAIAPNDINLCNNLGLTYRDLNNIDQARKFYEKAIMLDPDNKHLESRVNLANLLVQDNDYENAYRLFQEVLKKAPQSYSAHFGMSNILLAKLDYENGWKEYEWRLNMAVFNKMKNKISQPMWDGNSLEGKSLLIWTEQGFGDALQFIRYIPLILKKNPNHIVLQTREPLKTLFSYIPGIDEIITTEEHSPKTDFFLPLLSSPYLLGTTINTIPIECPYITIPDKLKKNWSQSIKKEIFNIGIVWSCSNLLSPERSCPLKYFFHLHELSNIQLHSLQKGEGEEELINNNQINTIIHHGKAIEDFSHTAAIISQLDLVITVDTAMAHLAGAMDIPTWVLLNNKTTWRWLPETSASLWYPSIKIFRQKKMGDWDSVFIQIIKALKKVIKS